MAQIDKEGKDSVFYCDFHAAAVFFCGSLDTFQSESMECLLLFGGLKRRRLRRQGIGSSKVKIPLLNLAFKKTCLCSSGSFVQASRALSRALHSTVHRSGLSKGREAGISART